jgi:hypothetical protein
MSENTNDKSSAALQTYAPFAGSVPALLIAVARAAHSLCDCCCHEGEDFKIEEETLVELENTLNVLDELPEPGPMICATGPAKAEAILQSDYDRINWLEGDLLSGVGFNVATSAWETDYLPEGKDCFFGSLRECVDAAMGEQNELNDLHHQRERNEGEHHVHTRNV